MLGRGLWGWSGRGWVAVLAGAALLWISAIPAWVDGLAGSSGLQGGNVFPLVLGCSSVVGVTALLHLYGGSRLQVSLMPLALSAAVLATVAAGFFGLFLAGLAADLSLARRHSELQPSWSAALWVGVTGMGLMVLGSYAAALGGLFRSIHERRRA